MGHISSEAKAMIVNKALNRGDKSIESIAKDNNISDSTLYLWLKCCRENPGWPEKKNSLMDCSELTRTKQFNHLVNVAKLDEMSLGAYCRQNGLYSHQLQQWKEGFMKMNEPKQQANEKAKLKALKAENDALKKELRRKDKALAEASALLVMKKKADLIWGKDEEE